MGNEGLRSAHPSCGSVNIQRRGAFWRHRAAVSAMQIRTLQRPDLRPVSTSADQNRERESNASLRS